MKTSIVALCVLSALAFALAGIAEFAGFIFLQDISISALVGGLAAAGVVAFAFRDYTRKPSFRVRRPAATPVRPALEESHGAAAASLDWTYATRTA